MSSFDRQNALFERERLPCTVVETSEGKKGDLCRNVYFTVRILRSCGSGEPVIRFELSDECSLLPMPFPVGTRTPRRNAPPPIIQPIIQAPFLSAETSRPWGPNETYTQSSSNQCCPVRTCSSSSTPHIDLYELELTETAFQGLQRDEALLIDFNGFATSLISLLTLCLGDDDKQHFQLDYVDGKEGTELHPRQQCQQRQSGAAWATPMHSSFQQNKTDAQHLASPYRSTTSSYSCRLELSSGTDPVSWRSSQSRSNEVAPSSARFSIVEKNQFRELTHLALNLSVGSDQSVRRYLSSRLCDTLLEKTRALRRAQEQQGRTAAAERDLVGLRKALDELTANSNAERFHLQSESEKRLATNSSKSLLELNRLKSDNQAEINALTERFQKLQSQNETKIRVLEEANRKVNADKAACEKDKEHLTTKLSYQETSNKTLTNELTSLKSQLESVSKEKVRAEDSLNGLRLELSMLEHSNTDHEKTISAKEMQRQTAEKISEDVKETLARQKSQADDLSRRLEEAELELSKYKDLASRYSEDRTQMKKALKEKVEIIKVQEDSLTKHSQETSTLSEEARRLDSELKQAREDRETLALELKALRLRSEEDQTKLANNQSVIAYLNKQGGSHNNTGSDPATCSLAPLPPAAATRILPTPSHSRPHPLASGGESGSSGGHLSSNLSRYLPNSAYEQQQFITPDLRGLDSRQGLSIGSRKLHPDPTPFIP